MSGRSTGERERMATFLDLDLIPVVDELTFLARQVLGTAEGTGYERRLRTLVARLDGLHHGALELWRDLLREPAQRKASGQ